MPRCRKKYTQNPRYTLEQAREIYRRFLNRGYDPEEAREFTRAITGIEVEHLQPKKQLVLEVAGA
jgi:SOS response regulatory protein OraA/RecX